MAAKEKEPAMIHVLIIEDNKFIRQGWKLTIDNEPYFKVVGAFDTCEDALKQGDFENTDVVLMDIGLPGMSGIEGVKRIKADYPDIVIVMCTVHDDNEKIFEALCAGAVGYLLKKTPPEALLKSIREAYEGGSPMTPTVARKVIASFQQASAEKGESAIKLSDREEQILQLMAKGKTYADIAYEIFLSVDGVYYHIRHIYEKLQVHTRGEAVAEAIKKKLIPPPR